jgi:hypothetical protein
MIGILPVQMRMNLIIAVQQLAHGWPVTAQVRGDRQGGQVRPFKRRGVAYAASVYGLDNPVQ